jgi:hypothetical protein
LPYNYEGETEYPESWDFLVFDRKTQSKGILHRAHRGQILKKRRPEFRVDEKVRSEFPENHIHGRRKVKYNKNPFGKYVLFFEVNNLCSETSEIYLKSG